MANLKDEKPCPKCEDGWIWVDYPAPKLNDDGELEFGYYKRCKCNGG